VLLFLHADTDLPEGAIAAIQASHIQHHQATVFSKLAVGSDTACLHNEPWHCPLLSLVAQAALCDTRVMGGCFELRFHEEDQSWTLQLWSSLEQFGCVACPKSSRYVMICLDSECYTL
jgi:hypothetical protein